MVDTHRSAAPEMSKETYNGRFAAVNTIKGLTEGG